MPRATRLAVARLTFTLSIAVRSPTMLGESVPNRATIDSTRHSGMFRPYASEYRRAIRRVTQLAATDRRYGRKSSSLNASSRVPDIVGRVAVLAFIGNEPPSLSWLGISRML